MKKNLSLVFLALVLAGLALYKIAGAGEWYPMHDSTHLERIKLMVEAIRGGQFPPIWATGINNGLGYPLFHFYAPLFHLTASLFALVLPVLTAVKLTLLLTLATGVLGVMYLTRTWGKLASFGSGIAFALSPYIALSLYVRGSFSELLSLAILPWALYTSNNISSFKSLFWGSLTLALFVLSHNLIPVLALPLIFVWAIFHHHRSPGYLALYFLLAFLLSLWFTLPLVFERGFTVAEQVAKTTDYSLHFVGLKQIWNSTWGFGGSAPGVEDGMSFKLGKLQLILAGLGMILAVWKKSKLLTLLTGLTLFYVFLTSSASSVVWDNLPLLQLVQFPWRALGVIAVLLSIFAGYFVSRIPLKLIRALSVVVIGLALFLLNFKYFAPQSITTNLEFEQDIADVVPEFMPVWLTRPNPEIPSSSTILPHAYYPTWEVKIAGEQVATYPSVDGRLSFDNPGNSSNYSLMQGKTKLENISLMISVLTLTWSIFMYKKL